MNIFAVVLAFSNPEVERRVEDVYPEHFRLNDTFFLVPSSSIAETVAVKTGIKGDDRAENANGVVFKLNDAYAGHTTRALWDWLKTYEGPR